MASSATPGLGCYQTQGPCFSSFFLWLLVCLTHHHTRHLKSSSTRDTSSNSLPETTANRADRQDPSTWQCHGGPSTLTQQAQTPRRVHSLHSTSPSEEHALSRPPEFGRANLPKAATTMRLVFGRLDLTDTGQRLCALSSHDSVPSLDDAPPNPQQHGHSWKRDLSITAASHTMGGCRLPVAPCASLCAGRGEGDGVRNTDF